MKEKNRLDSIVETVQQRIQEEVGGLIGADLKLTGGPGTVISKESFFDQPSGKQVFAKMDMTGDLSGKGGLMISVKDAIRIGGTLIMLPQAELEEVVKSEEYDGETEDSYGEIANIIAGCYTKVFEEMHPKNLRFIRKEQEIITSVKVDVASEEPMPNGHYYQAISRMQLNDKQMGDLIMLIPAEPFGLAPAADAAGEEGQKDKEKAASSEAVSGTVEVSADDKSEEGVVDSSESETTPQTEPADNRPVEVGADPVPPKPSIDVEKQRQRVDLLLDTCRSKIEEEVGALLGVEISCSDQQNTIINKEKFFFEHVSGKQVVANMDVVGDLENKSYLYISLKDAIRIGCTLIMLPPNEMETAVKEDEFSVDSEDAYGEIANIISGVYTAVFETEYTKSLRFVKKDIAQIVPMKVDLDSEEPMPDQPYYMSSMKLAIDGTEHGRINLLMPADMLELELLAMTADDAAAAPPETGEKAGGAAAGEGQVSPATAAGTPAGSGQQAPHTEDILIISNSEPEAELIRTVLGERGYSCRQISYRDNINNYLPGAFKAIFLVMGTVDEQAFGMAIKISSVSVLPLIAAGPQWTRSKVIKAVKYGVNDILLTPASKGDVGEKIDSNIIKLAA